MLKGSGMKRICPECSNNKLWSLKDGRFRCTKCRKTFSDSRRKISISPAKLRTIIKEFLLGHSTNIILYRVDISKYMLLKILTLLRVAMTQDLPEVFEGTVEVDETYLGGQWKNKRLSVKRNLPKAKRGRGTQKQAVFGILCRNGKVWADFIDGVEAKQLQPRIIKQVKKGSTVFSDTWRGYTGIAAKGYVHRLVKHSRDNYVTNGNHINGLEGFWGYLKRKLAAKGGIRQSRLHLYLGEYVWRYNHRHLNLKEQENYLTKLFKKYIR
ncbi:MAG: IS1595 family transposase [Desulfobulbaceae bacterium]|nr:IS1595 family transposase [Desulfobulbaceae bacterium]